MNHFDIFFFFIFLSFLHGTFLRTGVRRLLPLHSASSTHQLHSLGQDTDQKVGNKSDILFTVTEFRRLSLIINLKLWDYFRTFYVIFWYLTTI